MATKSFPFEALRRLLASKAFANQCGGMALTVALAASVAGCGKGAGPERVPVAGTVSLDGEPLKAGCIRFIPTAPTTGPAAVGQIKEGAFELGTTDGPVPGTLRVEIEATDFQEFELDDEKAYAARAAKGRAPLRKNPIPATYNRHSTLTRNLAAEGDRQLDFTLSSKVKPGAAR